MDVGIKSSEVIQGEERHREQPWKPKHPVKTPKTVAPPAGSKGTEQPKQK